MAWCFPRWPVRWIRRVWFPRHDGSGLRVRRVFGSRGGRAASTLALNWYGWTHQHPCKYDFAVIGRPPTPPWPFVRFPHLRAAICVGRRLGGDRSGVGRRNREERQRDSSAWPKHGAYSPAGPARGPRQSDETRSDTQCIKLRELFGTGGGFCACQSLPRCWLQHAPCRPTTRTTLRATPQDKPRPRPDSPLWPLVGCTPAACAMTAP